MPTTKKLIYCADQINTNLWTSKWLDRYALSPIHMSSVISLPVGGLAPGSSSPSVKKTVVKEKQQVATSTVSRALTQEEKQEEAKIQRMLNMEIVNVGDKLIIPEGIDEDQAIEVLRRKRDQNNTEVGINATIEGFVFDAAYAFNEVLNSIFGFVNNVKIPGGWFVPDQPPVMVSVKTSRDKSVQVPWGRIVLPNIDGYLETSITERKGQIMLSIQGVIKKKHEKQINTIIDATRAWLKTHSIYKGQAISIRFLDDRGQKLPMPEPEFIALGGVKPDDLVFSASVARQVKTNIFTPIEHTEACKKAQIPIKRGVLLTGHFGVGKSMTANVTALKAVNNGWTFIMCSRADELRQVLTFAREYEPSVVFCEDVDRVISGERNMDMDDLLNLVDGVGTKGSEIVVILTTNAVEKINQAMFRPGRLDAIIEVTPPDAGAVEKLLRLYGRGLIPETEDLSEVCKKFAGNIPSVIREMVERSKLYAIAEGSLDNDNNPVVTADALLGSAEEMTLQRELLTSKVPDVRSEPVKAAQITADAIRTLGHSGTNGSSYDRTEATEVAIAAGILG